MVDSFSAAERSSCMARIRSRGNTTTESKLIALLRASKITGWRRRAKIFGNPDLVWRDAKIAVFVDGCFWHSCPRHGRAPNSRRDYWVPKLARNVRRDRAVSRKLRAIGWRVARVWECSLAIDRAEATVRRIRRM